MSHTLPAPAVVASPCINVCRMDLRSGLCEGCFRSLDEIVGWGNATDTRRLQILEAVEQRRAEHDSSAGSADGQCEGCDYLCVGICMSDPDSGYCLGCGRPPLPVSRNDQRIVVEELRSILPISPSADPDSPERASAKS